MSGLVLSLGRPLPAPVFYRRRAHAILPNYWLGSLAVFLLLVGLAALRATFFGGHFLEQHRHPVVPGFDAVQTVIYFSA